MEKAAHEERGAEEFLRGLREEEGGAREENRRKRGLQQAHFPFARTMEQFDFQCRPARQRPVFLTYLEDRFIMEGRSLVWVGAPGLGKPHWAMGGGGRWCSGAMLCASPRCNG